VRPFDPYRFILLNLMLSCLAAVQAPIIMMSQNRQEARDRLRAESDYRVNLEAELEIRHVHEKLDHLLQHQWEQLIEIQQIQIELMNELSTSLNQSATGLTRPPLRGAAGRFIRGIPVLDLRRHLLIERALH
jgi:uncharacterized membrane protein